MLSLLLIFLTLISPCLYLLIKKNCVVEKTIPIVFFSIVLLLYVGGLLKFMRVMVYIIVFISLVLLVGTIVLFIKSNKKCEYLKKLLSPAFVIWIFMFCFLCLYHSGRMLVEWDEFTHWGDVVKVMYTINDFSTNPKSLSAFQSYLPAMSLFQYFWQVIGGKFIEWYLFVSYQLFIVTLFMPFLSNLKWDKNSIIKILGAFAFILFIPLIFFTGYYTSCYVDSFLSAIFAYSVASVFFAKKYDKFEILNITMALVILTLTKDIGIVFAAITIFIALIDILFIQNDTKLSDFKLKNITKILLKIKPIIIFSISCLSSYILWKINIKINHASTAFSSPIHILQILNVFLGRDNTYKSTVLTNYVNQLSTAPMVSHNLSINIYATLSILIGIMYLIYIANNKDRKTKLFFWIFMLGEIAYLLLMVILYMSKFMEYEAVRLASFNRYMSIYLEAIIMVITFVIISNSHKQEYMKCFLVLFIFTMFFTPINNIYNGYLAKSSSKRSRENYTKAAKIINDKLKSKKKNIYFIVQNSSGYGYWVLKFSSRENLSGINTGFSWSLGKPYYDGDIWTKNISSEKWMNELVKDYDYVFLYNVDKKFIKKYGDLFDNKDNIEDNKLCKVDKKLKKLVCE